MFAKKCIHQQFEEIAARTPESIAVCFKEQHLSYNALNNRANQLAHYLRLLGVTAESRVGIALPRGIDLIIGLLAILKAGGTYVPLPIDYPLDRLIYMVKDSQINLVLSLQCLEILPDLSLTTVHLDKCISDNQPITNLDVLLAPENLAYITYTSGSTGTPKGVACDHAGVMNRLFWGWDNYAFKKDEICCLQSSIAFVDSTWDIFGTLLVGAKLVLYEEAISKDIEALLNICFSHQINRITLIPSFLNTMLSFSIEKMRKIKKYLTHWEITGEAFAPGLIDHFFEKLDHAPTLLDCYGATEATSVIYRDYIGKNGLKYQTKILSNTQVHLLDESLNPVPIGIEGEIYIGGVGLARGYLNKPGATAERFIPSPFETGRRLYKTGDLGRYLPDGNLEFLGRIDYQLKIRGFRVEPGEIERTIEVSDAVQQAVILYREDLPGQKRLTAYIVPKDKDNDRLLETVQALCQQRLPDYMQPDRWVVLDAWPLTPNGKIDRNALPKPEGRVGFGDYEAPINKLENQIAAIWSELLALEIGRNDDFFRLGGHSLLAIQMVSRLREVLHLEVPIKTVFEHRILSKLAQYLEQSHLPNDLLPPISVISRDPPQSLSFAQRRLWFLEHLLPNTDLYHNVFRIKIVGQLNVVALKKALNAIVARHEILRTVILNVNGVAVQKVLPKETGFKLTESQAGAADETIQVFIKKAFQFEQEPLCRGLLLKSREQEHILIFIFHHIVIDDWSMAIFCKELNTYYQAYANNKGVSLPPLPVQYIDYSVWQRNWLQGEILEKQLIFWQTQLRDVARLELPIDFPRPKELSYQGGFVHQKISKEILDELKAFSNTRNVTLFMSLLACIQGFLARYCNQTDIPIGAPIANRRTTHLEGLIGFFVNTLVLRTQVDEHLNFENLVKLVESNTLLAYEHQDVPFEQLVEYLQVPRELNRNPLFQVLFHLQLEKEQFRLGNLQIGSEETEEQLARFDLLINAFVESDGLYLRFDYLTELFTRQRIERLSQYFVTFLCAILKEPTKRLSEISFLGTEEQEQLFAWNQTEHPYSKDQSIQQLFEKQVEKTPLHIALVYDKEEMSYQLLNERSNQVAHYLRKKGIGPDTFVAIMLERSIDMLIGILGVLKAGGAYIPLDAMNPAHRIHYLLEDTQPIVLLTHSHLNEMVSNYQGLIINLDDSRTQQLLQQEAKTNLKLITLPHHLAYVIYTSGSTGKPKGVMIEHQNLTHYMTHAERTYPLSAGMSLFHGSYAFDMSITSLFLPLIQGHAICVVPQTVEAEALGEFIKENDAINLIKLTPTHLKALKEQLTVSDIQKQKIALIIGGERLLNGDIAYWKKASPNAYIVNEYGPTEATVGCAIYQIKENSAREVISIGYPIANTQIYILDASQQTVAVGVVGEIYIGGHGLARGYWDRPALTAERFIPNPFGKGTRLYKTGDLARYHHDGSIEYLGRCDDQVKVRGYRIELGEIEAALSSHADIAEVVVIARAESSGMNKLIAYLVPTEFTPSRTELREYLADRLPNYMIPSFFIYLERIPLTLNGKLDHKALPSPDMANGSSHEYVAPRNAKEQELVDIWCSVLGIERVGITDHFFQIGGDSIISIQLVSKARQKGIKFTVKDIFMHPTIETLTSMLLEKEQLNLPIVQNDSLKMELISSHDSLDYFAQKIKNSVGKDINLEDIYPLSPLQAGLLFQSLFEPDSDAYFVQSVLKIDGKIDAQVLQQAWQATSDHHPILRTGLLWEDQDKPLQYVVKTVEVPFEVENCHGMLKEAQEVYLTECIEAERKRGFSLSQAPLFRIKLITVSDVQSYLIWSFHHIISDGWSNPLILADVFRAYESVVLGKKINLPSRTPYKQYIDWLEGQDKEKAREYWQMLLKSVEGATRLTFSKIRQDVLPSQKHETLEIELSFEETKAVQQFARDQRITLNTVLQGTVGLLLQHYTQKSEIVMGVTISGRAIDLSGIEGMVGLFINTLPLKVDSEPDDTVESYLQRLQERTQQLNEYSYTPLSEIYRWTSHSEGLFDVLFVFENYPLEEAQAITQTFQITNHKVIERTEYPLTIVVELGKKISFIFQYQTEHFDKAVIERIAEHLKILLVGMKNSKMSPLCLTYLSKEEHRQLELWNTTHHLFPEEKTVHQLFEGQVLKQPNAIALIYEQETLTYQSLNDKANQLAHYLKEQGVGSESLVTIAIERSVDMLIGLLGILKAGAAYVPLDPTYPEERLLFMLEDTKSALLITKRDLSTLFSKYNGKIVLLDQQEQEILKQAKHNPRSLNLLQQIAYVIYTSGSTGKPKGAMIPHHGLLNRLLWMKEHYAISSNDRILQKTPFTFDVSVWELFLPLISGATEIIASPGIHKEPDLIWNLIQDKKVSVCHFVPPMLASFLDNKEKFGDNNLRVVFTSGDVLSQEVVKAFYGKFHSELHNLYGPTEASIDVTYYHCSASHNFAPPIGQPIWNTQLYILNAHLNPVPVGVSGDLYIGGVGLARGYLNRPDLTAEKFIPNPFMENSPEYSSENLRLYYTGDLARYLPDGNIEFLGRRDDQVKIRGFRIELGEIEARIASCEEISQVVVIANEDTLGYKRLVAYFVPAAACHSCASLILIEQLKAYLISVLPDYMIPAFFIRLDEIPLTHNGKVNRKALPRPEVSANLLSENYLEPRTEKERALCDIWKAVLGLEQVGIRDHFFRIGGDSIISIQLVSKARQKGMQISVKDVFNHPTIEALANVADMVTDSGALRAEQGLVYGAVPLTPIQQWFFGQNPAIPHHFNQVMWINSVETIDQDKLQDALKVLYRHHDAFRLRYKKNSAGWEQYYGEEFPLPWQVREIAVGEDLAETCTALQGSLDIEHGPLSQIIWFKGTKQFLWIIHHLIIDGVSWRILLDDLNLVYSGKALGPKSHSFSDWSHSLAQYTAPTELKYYQTHLKDIPKLTTDHQYSSYIALKDVQKINMGFSEDVTKRFLQKAHQSYGTQPDDLLLLALVQSVGDCFGRYEVCVDLEGHGREELGQQLDLTSTIGWFTSMHPVVLALPEPSNLDHSIKHIKEYLRCIPQKGVSYGIFSRIQGSCRYVQGDVLFNYLGQWSTTERKGETFFFGTEETGLSASLENPHVHPLAINGGVNKGILEFHWSYSTHHYKSETIEKLVKAFHQRLEALIEYCSEDKNFGFSPSDFPHIKLKGKQLDNLLRKLGGQK